MPGAEHVRELVVLPGMVATTKDGAHGYVLRSTHLPPALRCLCRWNVQWAVECGSPAFPDIRTRGLGSCDGASTFLLHPCPARRRWDLLR